MKKDKNKEKVLTALRNSLGNISVAVGAGNISRSTFYNWLKSDKEFAEEVEAITAECGDWVESKLLQLIKAGDTTATIFYCKTKLKNRGYCERHELTGKDGNNLVVTFDNQKTAEAVEKALNGDK